MQNELKPTVGKKYRGIINGELFEIVGEFVKDGKTSYKMKHLKTGKVYDFGKRHLENLLLKEVLEEAKGDAEDERKRA